MTTMPKILRFYYCVHRGTSLRHGMYFLCNSIKFVVQSHVTPKRISCSEAKTKRHAVLDPCHEKGEQEKTWRMRGLKNECFQVWFPRKQWKMELLPLGTVRKRKLKLRFSAWSPEVAVWPAMECSLSLYHLTRVPLHLWNVEGFHTIVSKFGILQRIDSRMLDGVQLKYAKVLVEVHYKDLIPNKIKIMSKGECLLGQDKGGDS